jgi:hypothetical protein
MADTPKTKPENPSQKRAFVITPIGSDNSPERLHADWILNIAIKPVFESNGYTVHRSDTIADPSMINDAIFNHVVEDEICIADLSFLNPNVFYELGVRHALEKPVIHIAHNQIKLPFDTAQHRVIFFNLSSFHSIEALKEQLEAQLKAIETKGFRVSNPLTHARGRQNLSKSADSTDQIVVDLLDRIGLLEQMFRQPISRNAPVRMTDSPSNAVRRNGAPYDLSKAREEIRHLARRISKYSEVIDENSPLSYGDFMSNFGSELQTLTREDRAYISDVVREMITSQQVYEWISQWIR